MPSGIGEGNSHDHYPFGSFGANSGYRLQQVISANDFSSISNGGAMIEGIAFRLDGTHSDFVEEISLTRLDIFLSTINREPDNLSTVFAENTGSDVQLVKTFNGTFRVQKSFDPPQPFLIRFMFDRSFFYHPRAGNLLIDFRNYTIHPSPQEYYLDAHDITGDSVSSLFGGNTNSAGGQYTRAYVMLIFTQPIQYEPFLKTEIAGGDVIVRWPLYGSNYVLQSTSSLVNPQWQTMEQAPQQQGSNYVHQFALTNSHRFFRLFH